MEKSCESYQEEDPSEGMEESSVQDSTSPLMEKAKISQKNPAKSVTLPKTFKKIKFKTIGAETWQYGKVMARHKKKSLYKNVVGIKLEDGTDKEIDFSIDIEEWKEIDGEDGDDNYEPCCSVLHSKVITKAQASKRHDFEAAIKQEIKKFEDFEAFKRVKDDGQFAIKTRWVYSESDDLSKGYCLKARLCMRGDTEENKDSIRADSPTAQKDSQILG